MYHYDVAIMSPLIIEGIGYSLCLPYHSQVFPALTSYLGMDWLKAHTALIDCAAKIVQLLHPSDQIVNYSVRTIQNAEAQIYALNA